MTDTALRLLTFWELYKLGIRYSRQHLYRLEKAGLFPRRVKLTPGGRVGWIEEEVLAWLKARIQSRDEAPPLVPELCDEPEDDPVL